MCDREKDDKLHECPEVELSSGIYGKSFGCLKVQSKAFSFRTRKCHHAFSNTDAFREHAKPHSGFWENATSQYIYIHIYVYIDDALNVIHS